MEGFFFFKSFIKKIRFLVFISKLAIAVLTTYISLPSMSIDTLFVAFELRLGPWTPSGVNWHKKRKKRFLAELNKTNQEIGKERGLIFYS